MLRAKPFVFIRVHSWLGAAAPSGSTFLLRLLAIALWTAAMPAAPISFSHDLAPILADKCLTCHQEKKAKGKYRVDSFEALLKPGESKDPSLTAGKPDASSLYTRLVATEEDDRMPQKDDALPAAQIALFKQWIEQGAKFDGADAKLPLRELLTKKEAPKAPEKYPLTLPITALAFSTDGRSIFTSGYREVLEWSTEDGKLLRRIGGTPERILALSMQPGGKLLALAGGTPGRNGETLVLDVAKGTVAKRLPGSKDTVLAVAFSPDGSLLASGGTDNSVHVFRTSDWKQLWQAEAHADWIMALTFSQDGKDLASVSRDRSARVFDAQSGEIQFTYAEHQSAVRSVAFDPEGQTALSGSTDGELRRWIWHEEEPDSKDKKDDQKKDEPKKEELEDKKNAAAKPEDKSTKQLKKRRPQGQERHRRQSRRQNQKGCPQRKEKSQVLRPERPPQRSRLTHHPERPSLRRQCRRPLRCVYSLSSGGSLTSISMISAAISTSSWPTQPAPNSPSAPKTAKCASSAPPTQKSSSASSPPRAGSPKWIAQSSAGFLLDRLTQIAGTRLTGDGANRMGMGIEETQCSLIIFPILVDL